MKKIFLTLLSFITFSAFAENPSTFDSYVKELKKEAAFKGFDKAFLDKTFIDINYYQEAVDKDKFQPEFTRPFKLYYQNLVNDERIKNGKTNLKKYRTLLNEVSAKTGVPAKILVAFWGAETNYGTNKGSFDILSTTATMAYDGRREAFFKSEFFAALKILKQGHIQRKDFKGSWAGAFGNFQFMPTTFDMYKEGKIAKEKVDIVTNLQDSFYSAAAYLKRMGWEKDEKWGRVVDVPFEALMNDITDTYQPLSYYKDLDIKTIDGKSLPVSDIKAKLLLPSGVKGPAFLVYPNFDKILKWNRSNFYALSIGLLADQIEGKPIKLLFPEEKRFTVDEIQHVQHILKRKDYYTCEVDGVMGSCMKKAIKAFQKTNGMLIDGYLSPELYKLLDEL